MTKRILSAILCAAVLLGMASGTGSKDGSKATFPAKQLTVVVPYAPGGASDMTARIFAQELEKVLGKPVIVTNKTGASGAVGLEFVKNSTPDGYTLAYMPVESTMISALGLTDLTSSNFKFIGRAMTIPAAVTVSANAKWNTLEEFLKDAAANPSKIKVGNSGTGSIWHISAAQLEQTSKAKFTHVPFDGAAPAIAALLGGNIDAVTVSPSEVKSAVDGGQFKVLAVLGEKRSSVVPNVATAKEHGVNVVAQGWGGFAVPAKTPADVVAILDAAAKIAINTDSVKKFLGERGFEFAYLPGAEMDAVAKQQLDMYAKLIPSLGIVNK